MTLAQHANTALYASMIVFTLAMLAFVGHLALRAPAAHAERLTGARRPALRESALVGARGRSAATSLERDGYDTGADTRAETATASQISTGTANGTSTGVEDEGDEPTEPGEKRALRARQRGGIALMLTYLATALLVASVAMRGIAVSRPPWGDMFEFATASAAAVALVYSVLAKRNGWQWLGAFVVTPVLLVLGVSLIALYTEAGELMPALKSYWLGIHVSVAFLAVAFFTISAVTGALYLLLSRREERARGGQPVRSSFLDSLPSAPALERTTYSLNVAGFILWTFTLIAGAIWAKEAWGAYWQWDPKEVWTFVIWAIYAAYLHARATAGVDLRRANIIGLVGFVAVIINFTLVNLVSTFVGMHNYSGM